MKLEATITPPNATNKNVTWNSSNTKVATVDKETGVVTTKALGEATITATAGGKTASCKVTVVIPTIEEFKVKINKNTGKAEIDREAVTLVWKKNQYAKEYQIWKSTTGKNGTYKKCGDPTKKTEFKVTGLKANTTYFFKITAINDKYDARAATRLDAIKTKK